jgi:hypothetical protein
MSLWLKCVGDDDVNGKNFETDLGVFFEWAFVLVML